MIGIIILILLLTLSPAKGHDIYATWKDSRGSSCCSDRDCYATSARFAKDHWQAKRREDGAWLDIPWDVIINERPDDMQAHMCAPPPGGLNFFMPRLTPMVWCFVPPQAGL